MTNYDQKRWCARTAILLFIGILGTGCVTSNNAIGNSEKPSTYPLYVAYMNCVVEKTGAQTNGVIVDDRQLSRFIESAIGLCESEATAYQEAVFDGTKRKNKVQDLDAVVIETSNKELREETKRVLIREYDMYVRGNR